MLWLTSLKHMIQRRLVKLDFVWEVHSLLNVLEVNVVVAFYGIPSLELVDPTQIKASIQALFRNMDNYVGFSDITTAKALEEKMKAIRISHKGQLIGAFWRGMWVRKELYVTSTQLKHFQVYWT
ncbi:hypothetical protein VNO77_37352 [Canavalia gladiata]|uniref:Dienelactone hydrolase domain-containing protein n=1 Tax=Canavalia gladiata TaxID=3824 RepID=A0AAN9KAF8_CANGL